MGRFRAKEKGYDGNVLRYEGDVFEFEGKPLHWMEPLDAKASKGKSKKASKEDSDLDEKDDSEDSDVI